MRGNGGEKRYGKIWVLMKMRTGCRGCIAYTFFENDPQLDGQRVRPFSEKKYTHKMPYRTLALCNHYKLLFI
jgi:hypothetical protein